MGAVRPGHARRAGGHRRLDAFLRDVGPGIARLPWARPADAARWLEPGDRERLARLGAQIEESWLHAEPHLAVVGALTRAWGDDAVAVYPGAPPGGPRWFTHTFDDGLRPSGGPMRNHHVLPEVRLYELDRVDPFADRPVACGPLFAGATTGNDPMGLIELILEPNGCRDQLRMVVYERGAITLFAGVYRRGRDMRRFDERDHALLLAARPRLRAWARTAAAIGVAPLGDGALVGALDALDRPALLLRRGAVVHANALGRALVGRTATWHRAGRPAGFATTTRLEPGGLQVDLVLPHAVAPAAGLDARGASAAPGGAERDPTMLPPSLSRVADLLADGLADKDIADRLAMPLATARTYVARTLRRLGLRDRRALILARRR